MAVDESASLTATYGEERSDESICWSNCTLNHRLVEGIKHENVFGLGGFAISVLIVGAGIYLFVRRKGSQ